MVHQPHLVRNGPQGQSLRIPKGIGVCQGGIGQIPGCRNPCQCVDAEDLPAQGGWVLCSRTVKAVSGCDPEIALRGRRAAGLQSDSGLRPLGCPQPVDRLPEWQWCSSRQWSRQSPAYRVQCGSARYRTAVGRKVWIHDQRQQSARSQNMQIAKTRSDPLNGAVGEPSFQHASRSVNSIVPSGVKSRSQGTLRPDTRVTTVSIGDDAR